MTVGHLNTAEGITHLICQNILRSLTVFTATVTPFSHTGATSLWGISSDLPPVSQPPFMTLTVPDITTKEQLHTSFLTACPYHSSSTTSVSMDKPNLSILATQLLRHLHPPSLLSHAYSYILNESCGKREPTKYMKRVYTSQAAKIACTRTTVLPAVGRTIISVYLPRNGIST